MLRGLRFSSRSHKKGKHKIQLLSPLKKAVEGGRRQEACEYTGTLASRIDPSQRLGAHLIDTEPSSTLPFWANVGSYTGPSEAA
jgi:hypothetical protein